MVRVERIDLVGNFRAAFLLTFVHCLYYQCNCFGKN